MRIAFYAPLKEPHHPVPSGDREVARLLMAALRAGGHGVEVASAFRCFLPAPDRDRMAAVEAGAAREAERLAARFAADGPPDLWFTYHSHYKAPDLIGPAVSARFALPYVLAEASHASKRAAGAWAAWHRANEAAIRAAKLHVCFTPRDAEGLAGLVAPGRTMLLPPFVAAHPFGAVAREPSAGSPVALVTVAMMRAGDKLRSFTALAEALRALPAGRDWRLTVVGDGPERRTVEAAFAVLPAGRVAWAGERDVAGVAEALASADLYVWPGFGEAFGMAYLEAAAAGLPVLAMDCGGIASVVERDVTGVLTPEGDVFAFAAALSGLMADAGRRGKLGAAGRRLVARERSVERAAAVLAPALAALGRRA